MKRYAYREGKSDTNSSEAGSSDLKQTAKDAWDGSWSCSNKYDQSGLNSGCTVTWKANGKTTKLLLSWIIYLQNQEQKQDASSEEKTIQR